jgi:chromosome segregation ATPase
MKTQNKIMNQAAKQIFMQYLTNDIYIESIENCFNTQDVNKYFENIYNLSAQIKPNIIIDYWKNLLSSNKELVKTIEQYNLDTSLENKINEFSNFKKVEDINKDENQQFIIKLLKEMTEYISNLRKTIMNQSNTFEDLNKQKKHLENNINSLTKTENKYKEEIKNFTNKINENNNQINSLNNELDKYKKENEKLNNEKKELLNEKNKSIQNEAGLTEKVSSSVQKCELYKIENVELMNKITENKTEIEDIKLKNENLKKQVKLYKEKTAQMEKMSQTLKEQDSQLIMKENEIKKLKKSYEELEEFFENLKQEKENMSQNNQKQINELISEKKNCEKIIEEKTNEINQLKGVENNSDDPNNPNKNVNNEKYEQIQNKIFNLELDNTNLKEQNNKLTAINKDLVSKLQNENKNYEKVVDKTMISSMLIKYFNPSTPSSIKSSLLETIANFLEYNDEEREQIGLPSKSGANNDNTKSSGGNISDQLSKIGNNLYNFITNS